MNRYLDAVKIKNGTHCNDFKAGRFQAGKGIVADWKFQVKK
jgi:hypothetical protein